MKIAIVFGTRPELIKLAPVIFELRKYPKIFNLTIVSTGQHKEMLNELLNYFNLKPDYNLNIMIPKQSLFDVNKKILTKIQPIFEFEKPDLLIVQGDTLTAFVSAISAFYLKIPIAHIEAGLRSFNKYDPYPEEISRQLIDVLSDIYFAPTPEAQQNLLSEGVNEKKIFVTGNTVIDTLTLCLKLQKSFINKKLNRINYNRKVLLLTCHRRESWGETMTGIFEGIKDIVDNFEEIEVIFPLHPNPSIKKAASKIFKNHPRIHIFPPLIYPDMVNLMKKTFIIATDSGGLQEEAPFLNKPVVLLRQSTERIEGLNAGNLLVAGTARKDIYHTIKKLILNQNLYQKIAQSKNPYGDGEASKRIRLAIYEHFKKYA